MSSLWWPEMCLNGFPPFQMRRVYLFKATRVPTLANLTGTMVTDRIVAFAKFTVAPVKRLNNNNPFASPHVLQPSRTYFLAHALCITRFIIYPISLPTSYVNFPIPPPLTSTKLLRFFTLFKPNWVRLIRS